jgi:hypothetical protein
VEVKAHSEHEQDDAEFGKLIGDVAIRDEAGRMGTQKKSGEKIADDRRQTQFEGRQAKGEGDAESGGEGQEEVCLLQISG